MTVLVDHMHVEGLKVAYRYLGDASLPPLVFLHGLGDSSIMTFESIARHHALGGRSSLLIDLPGFGHSSAPPDWPATIEEHTRVVARLLDQFGIARAPVSGHSMGGSIGLMLATSRPDLVSRLVLAEPLLLRQQSELARLIARRTEPEFVQRGMDMLRLATRRQAARGERAAMGFHEPLQHADAAIMHRSAVSLLADRSPSFLDMLATLTIPRHLIVGEQREIAPGLIPDDVPLHRIPDAGHAMMHDNPDAYARAIATALGDTGASGGQQRRSRRTCPAGPKAPPSS